MVLLTQPGFFEGWIKVYSVAASADNERRW